MDAIDKAKVGMHVGWSKETDNGGTVLRIESAHRFFQDVLIDDDSPEGVWWHTPAAIVSYLWQNGYDPFSPTDDQFEAGLDGRFSAFVPAADQGTVTMLCDNTLIVIRL